MWVRIALALALLSGPAWAQTAPTRPITDNSNAIATTAFAQTLVGSVTVNVKTCGAKGDGTTNDTAAIAACVTKGTGGSIYFPASSGCYPTDQITIPAFTSLIGDGVNSSILCARANSQTIASISSGAAADWHSRFQHLGFSANNHTGVTGIANTLGYYTLYDDLNFVGTTFSIVLTRANFFTIRDILAEGSLAWGLAGPQLSVGAASPNYSQNGTIINYQYLGIGGVSNPTQTILLRRATNVDIVSYQSNDLAGGRAITIDDDSQGISIIGGQITHPTEGIVTNANGGNSPTGISIVGTQIDQATASGVLLQTGTQLSVNSAKIYTSTNNGVFIGVGNAQILNNLIHATINGIEVATSASNVQINGNTFDTISNDAILLDGSNTNIIAGLNNLYSNGVATVLSGAVSDNKFLGNLVPNVTGTQALGGASNVVSTTHEKSVTLYGSSSGTTVIQPAAAAGSTTLTLPAGTTDFSATGGTSQVVKQTSVGGALTVGTVANTDISGLGTGVATWLGTPSSANLASALTDELGTGSAVFDSVVTERTSCITGVNFNSGNSDNAITLALPTGYTRAYGKQLTISNASHTLTTATVGLFSTTGGGGTAIVTGGTSVTVSATADLTANNFQVITPVQTIAFISASLATANTLQFRIGTAEGSAATADVCLVYGALK